MNWLRMMRERCGIVLMATALALACHDDPVSNSGGTGTLVVSVTGLNGIAGNIRVSAGTAFDTTISGSATLSQLAVGTYTVTASTVTSGTTELLPVPATQQVAVQRNATATANIAYGDQAVELDVATVTVGLSRPVYLISPPGDARLFVVEQGGRVRIIRNGAVLPTPFIDISARISSGGEQGLLSIAFHPQYASNGVFFLYFTDPAGDITVERFTAQPASDVANTASQLVIRIPHSQFGNHNGGLATFGPDGMLYLGTGDGGGGGDPNGNAQRPTSLLGKILRLDVSVVPYANVGSEVWARGVRNPWRFDFRIDPENPATGDLYIADVGQNEFEEIDVARGNPSGLNYGWNQMEGLHCYPSGAPCAPPGMTLPVLEYPHSQGCSITGGFVYRGAAIPALRDHFFYSDYCTGFLRSIRMNAAGAPTTFTWQVPSLGNVLSFGEDAAGELYILNSAGVVLKLIRKQG